jgi:hypothetical protein
MGHPKDLGLIDPTAFTIGDRNHGRSRCRLICDQPNRPRFRFKGSDQGDRLNARRHIGDRSPAAQLQRNKYSLCVVEGQYRTAGGRGNCETATQIDAEVRALLDSRRYEMTQSEIGSPQLHTGFQTVSAGGQDIEIGRSWIILQILDRGVRNQTSGIGFNRPSFGREETNQLTFNTDANGKFARK